MASTGSTEPSQDPISFDLVLSFLERASEGFTSVNITIRLIRTLHQFGQALSSPDSRQAVLNIVLKCPENQRQEEILQQFERVYAGIALIRQDLKEMTLLIKTMDHYARLDPYLTTLGTAQHLFIKGQHSTLKGFCSNASVYHALLAVITKAADYLDSVYDYTRGHRPELAVIVHRLTGLVGMSLAAFQLTYQPDAYEQFKTEINAMTASFERTLKKCLDEVQVNMKADIVHFNEGSNEETLEKLRKELVPKYDWLALVIYVYDEKKSKNIVVVFAENKDYDRVQLMLELRTPFILPQFVCLNDPSSLDSSLDKAYEDACKGMTKVSHDEYTRKRKETAHEMSTLMMDFLRSKKIHAYMQ